MGNERLSVHDLRREHPAGQLRSQSTVALVRGRSRQRATNSYWADSHVVWATRRPNSFSDDPSAHGRDLWSTPSLARLAGMARAGAVAARDILGMGLVLVSVAEAESVVLVLDVGLCAFCQVTTLVDRPRSNPHFRFWFVYHAADVSIFGTDYRGTGFFDFVVVWLEFGPFLLILAVKKFGQRSWLTQRREARKDQPDS